MEKIFMSAGVIAAIVLCLVGVIKSPFDKFKKSKPKLYKAVFTILSIVLSVVVTVIEQLYISFDKILSINFAVKITFVIAGVFCGYGGIYEGLGLKDLFSHLIKNINKAIELKKQNEANEKKNKDIEVTEQETEIEEDEV